MCAPCKSASSGANTIAHRCLLQGTKQKAGRKGNLPRENAILRRTEEDRRRRFAENMWRLCKKRKLIPQGEGRQSCASLGPAPGQGEKGCSGRRGPPPSRAVRIHAPQAITCLRATGRAFGPEPFADIVDPHRPAGSDLPGNRDFERIGSLRAGDDGIAQGEQATQAKSRREPVEKEQGNDAADDWEPRPRARRACWAILSTALPKKGRGR